MRRTVLVICGGVSLAVALSGCDTFKRAFGLEKTVPNEFDVVENAPLAIPPDFNLRPPRPGAGPTQGVSPTAEARQTIFRAGGNNGPVVDGDNQMSTGETDILRAAGADSAPGDIRQVVNREAADSQPFGTTFVDKLIFWRKPRENAKGVLDPVKETARLEEQNAAAKKTVSTQFSSPPTVDRKSDTGSFFDRLF
ncbi:MAG TPA: DUF3035 domain-containing protein [Stellaceae bacterium]|jgi:hypothetical protein|nr:DUF3035 domain-containing protein [Stellaceae bacterium]